MSFNSCLEGEADVYDNTQNLDRNFFVTEEHYAYMSVDKLILTADRHRYQYWKCRTVGILRSVNGHFYLNNLHEESNLLAPKILASMLYQENIPNSVLPMSVQVFGVIQWIEKPVLMVDIIHVLNPRLAVNIHNSLSAIEHFPKDNQVVEKNETKL